MLNNRYSSGVVLVFHVEFHLEHAQEMFYTTPTRVGYSVSFVRLKSKHTGGLTRFYF